MGERPGPLLPPNLLHFHFLLQKVPGISCSHFTFPAGFLHFTPGRMA